MSRNQMGRGPQGQGQTSTDASSSSQTQGQTSTGTGPGPRPGGPQEPNTGASFTFSADNSTVESMTLGSTANSRTMNISNSTFETTTGTNDLGVNAVISVEETHTGPRSNDTRIFQDQDGDGQYTASFAIHVATVAGTASTTTTTSTTPPSAPPMPQHQFTFNADGSIASDTIQLRNMSRVDAIESNEVYVQTTLGGDSYVVKTVAETNGGYHFEVFRDDNADGTWSEIASGHSSGTYIDASTGSVSLVGIQDYLASADLIVG